MVTTLLLAMHVNHVRYSACRDQSFEPPSTWTISPVTHLASSEARKAMTPPMSSGCAMRLRACNPSVTWETRSKFLHSPPEYPDARRRCPEPAWPIGAVRPSTLNRPLASQRGRRHGEFPLQRHRLPSPHERSGPEPAHPP